MKFSHLLLVAITLVFLTACSKSSSSNNGSVQGYLINGQWFVHMFSEGGVDKTASFVGYKFTFDGAGTFVVVKDDISTNGTWTDDASSGKLIINMTTTDANLQKLINDWLVTGKAADLIEMKDDNSSSNEIFHLKKL